MTTPSAPTGDHGGLRAKINEDVAAGRVHIQGEWLVLDVGHHTCGTGPDGHFGAHEPGCGLEPIGRLEDLILAAHPEPEPAQVGEVAAVLAEHRWPSIGQWGACSCDLRGASMTKAEHAAHLAAHLAAVLVAAGVTR